MAKSIQERVRAQLAKQEAARKKAEQAPVNRRAAAQYAADVRIERGMERAMETGVARRHDYMCEEQKRTEARRRSASPRMLLVVLAIVVAVAIIAALTGG